MAAPTPSPPVTPTWRDALKSGISAAVIVFVTTFAPTAVGWFQALGRWASAGGHTPLPGVSTLGYAALSAALAALGGLGTGLFRWAQANWSWIPGTAPKFAPPVPSLDVPTPTPVFPPAPVNVVTELLAAIAARKQTIESAEADLAALRAALALPGVPAV